MTPDRGAAGHSAANLSVTGHGHGASGKFIEAVDLSLSFGSTPALRGASLGVAKGEIVAVMGPSGSGKSTLLHCLAGILVPSSGEVHFNGMRLDRLSDDRRSALRRDRFGFVFQSGQLVPELTAEENVALPLLLSGMRRGPAMAAARTWFPTLGLDGLESRRLTGARLSTLRGVVALEGAVPLLTVAVVAIGTGFGAAAMYATEAQNRPMVAPGLAYYLLTVGGIIVSLAIIAATFPILTRITGPEVARND